MFYAYIKKKNVFLLKLLKISIFLLFNIKYKALNTYF